MANRTIFYDLTEALLASSSKRLPYYGIARTVIEVGKHLSRLDSDVRFVVYSFGYRAFFEVHAQTDSNGIVSFDLPKDVGQQWVRSHPGGIASGFLQWLRIGVNSRNKAKWDAIAGHLKAVQITSGLWVSAARPKLIVDMIKTLREQDQNNEITVLVHDFMPLHSGLIKKWRRFDRNFLADNQFVLAESNHILTNSKFTRDDLLQFIVQGLLPKPKALDVVPLVHECPESSEPAFIELPTQPYLLTVGINLGRKNIEVILAALAKLSDNGFVVPQLVIAGAIRKRLRRYIKRPEFATFRDQIQFIDSPNQTDLVRLYEQALALVIPSRMEGWGLPAGEALWCGTPALCSTAPVLHEVCGDLGVYFDPDDAEGLSDIINRLLNDSNFREALETKILEAKPQLRTWRHVALDMIEAIRAQSHS